MKLQSAIQCKTFSIALFSLGCSFEIVSVCNSILMSEMHSHQMNALRQTNTHKPNSHTSHLPQQTRSDFSCIQINLITILFLLRLKYFPKMVHHKNSKAQRHIHVNQSNDAAAVTLFIRFYTLAMSGIHVFVYEFDPLSAPVFILSPNVCGVCVCELWHGIEHRSSTNKTDLCGVGMTISDTIQRHSSNNNKKTSTMEITLTF